MPNGVIVGTGMGDSLVPLMSTVAGWFIDKRSMMTAQPPAKKGRSDRKRNSKKENIE
jgi:hypothetical protein